MYISKTYYSFIIAAVATLVPLLCQASLGISPAQLGNDHVLAGTTLHYTLTASSGDISTDTTMQLTNSVQGDIQSWVVLSTDHLTLSADQAHNTIDVTVQVPNDASVGEYTGAIMMNEVDQSQSGSGADLHSLVTLSVPLHFSVTTETVSEYAVSDIGVVTQEEDDPITITFTVDNTGNVGSGPDRATLIVTTSDESTQLYEGSAIIQEITEPFSYANEHVTFDHTLPIGSYWLTAHIFDKSEEKQTRKLHLDIVAANTLPKSIATTKELTQSETHTIPRSSITNAATKSKSWLWIGLISCITALTGIILIIIFKLRKAKPNKKQG